MGAETFLQATKGRQSMTDKREVELPPIEITPDDVRKSSDLITMDGSGPSYPCYPEFQCRERQFRDALTRISQLEQQLVADREELRVTRRALEAAVNYLKQDWNKRGVHYSSEQFILDATAEGGR